MGGKGRLRNRRRTASVLELLRAAAQALGPGSSAQVPGPGQVLCLDLDRSWSSAQVLVLCPGPEPPGGISTPGSALSVQSPWLSLCPSNQPPPRPSEGLSLGAFGFRVCLFVCLCRSSGRGSASRFVCSLFLAEAPAWPSVAPQRCGRLAGRSFRPRSPRWRSGRSPGASTGSWF